jgi:hypothetical protein
MTDNSLAGRWISWAPYFLSLLRIIGGFLFVQHGGTKILGWPAPLMPGGGTAPLMSQAGVAGLLELCGGALLLAGAQQRRTRRDLLLRVALHLGRGRRAVESRRDDAPALDDRSLLRRADTEAPRSDFQPRITRISRICWQRPRVGAPAARSAAREDARTAAV